MRKLFCNQLHFLPQKKFLTTKKKSYHKKKILPQKKYFLPQKNISYHKKVQKKDKTKNHSHGFKT